jgi:hypothetical protein
MANKFRQYQLIKRKFKQRWPTNSANINKSKKSLNNDGQQIPPISTKQKKV